MARRTITDQRSEDDAEAAHVIDTEAEDISGLVEDERKTEQEILAEFATASGDVKMHFQVHKARPNSKMTDFCFEGTKDDFPIMERLQREFGSGTYQIMIFKTTERGTRLWKKPSIGILAPKNPQPVTATADPNLSALIQSLLDERKTKIPEVQNKPPNTLELLAGISAIVTAATPLLQMVFNSRAPTGSAKETLEMLATAKELFAGNEQEPKEETLMGVAKEVLPLFLSAAQNTTQQPPQLPAPQVNQQEREQAAMLAQLQQQLRFMITRAQKNSDPGLYADLLEDTLPPQYLQVLKVPGAFEYLVQLAPEIATHRPWFEAVLYALTNPPIDDNDEIGEDDNGVADAPTLDVSQLRPSAVATNYDARGFGGGPSNVTTNDGENESGESYGEH